MRSSTPGTPARDVRRCDDLTPFVDAGPLSGSRVPMNDERIAATQLDPGSLSHHPPTLPHATCFPPALRTSIGVPLSRYASSQQLAFATPFRTESTTSERASPLVSSKATTWPGSQGLERGGGDRDAGPKRLQLLGVLGEQLDPSRLESPAPGIHLRSYADDLRGWRQLARPDLRALRSMKIPTGVPRRGASPVHVLGPYAFHSRGEPAEQLMRAQFIPALSMSRTSR